MSESSDLKQKPIWQRGAETFFVIVGLLGSLHYLFDWPDEMRIVWIIAIGGAIGSVLGGLLRRRKTDDTV